MASKKGTPVPSPAPTPVAVAVAVAPVTADTHLVTELPSRTWPRAKMVDFCKARLRSTTLAVWLVGKALTEAKQATNYGVWGDFLKDVGISPASDYRYRRIVECFPEAGEKPETLPDDLMEAYHRAGAWKKVSEKKNSEAEKWGDTQPNQVQARPTQGQPEEGDGDNIQEREPPQTKGAETVGAIVTTTNRLNDIMKDYETFRAALAPVEVKNLRKALRDLGHAVQSMVDRLVDDAASNAAA